jgi:hypothetical protein
MANTKVTGDLIASSTIATGNIADNAVTSTKISGITTAHIAEGSNLYYTNARADARITAATTSDLTEGTNLYYTDARADARAALLVDSAPSTLNTLNELAAALGDDPNFATTVTNSIATKLPLAGGTLTGNLNAKNILFATSALPAANNPGINLRDTNNEFYIQSGSAHVFNFIRYDNRNSMMNIESTGINVTGAGSFTGIVTGSKLVSLDGILELDDNGTHNGIINSPASLRVNIDSDSGSGAGESFIVGHNQTAIDNNNVLLKVQDNGKVGINDNDPVNALEVKGTFAAPLTTGSAQNGIARFSQTAGAGSLDIGFGDPYSWLQSRSSSSYATNYNLVLQPNGGNVGIGTTSPSDKLQIVQGHSILVGDYFQLGSGSASIMGALGWNRDTTNGVIYNTNFGAFQMHNNEGKLCLQGYNSNGANQFQHEFYNNGDIYFEGNVLIGTTSIENPRGLAQALEIEAGSPVGIILNDSRDTHPMGIENAGAVMNFTYNTSPLMTILAGGNVGIGNTSPAQQLDILYPSYIGKDTVEGIIRLTGQSNTENAAGILSAGVALEFYNKWTGGAAYSMGRISGRGEQGYDGGLQFDVGTNTAPGQSGFTTAMTINADAKVGIGTSSPGGSKLTVSDGTAGYATTALIQVKRNAANGNDTTSKAGILLVNNSNGFEIAYGGTTDRLRILDGGAVERFTILNGGNVGIGETVPTQKLDVNGLVKHKGLDMTAGVQVDQTTSISVSLSGAAGSWNETGIDGTDIGSNGSYVIQVYSNTQGAGASNYSMYWTGTMSWYAFGTNSGNTSEIYLNSAGHYRGMDLELRTISSGNGNNPPSMRINFKSNQTLTGHAVVFKFRRLM